MNDCTSSFPSLRNVPVRFCRSRLISSPQGRRMLSVGTITLPGMICSFGFSSAGAAAAGELRQAQLRPLWRHRGPGQGERRRGSRIVRGQQEWKREKPDKICELRMGGAVLQQFRRGGVRSACVDAARLRGGERAASLCFHVTLPSIVGCRDGTCKSCPGGNDCERAHYRAALRSQFDCIHCKNALTHHDRGGAATAGALKKTCYIWRCVFDFLSGPPTLSCLPVAKHCQCTRVKQHLQSKTASSAS